jgi:hypothetical protein
VIAPDGRTVALLTGTAYADAGFIDLSLGFITLDENLDGTNFFFAQDFAPIPPDSRGQIYPDFDFAEQDPTPGTWDDSNTFRAHLHELAQAYPGFEPGVYLLHVDTLSAERVGDLP